MNQRATVPIMNGSTVTSVICTVTPPPTSSQSLDGSEPSAEEDLRCGSKLQKNVVSGHFLFDFKIVFSSQDSTFNFHFSISSLHCK